MLTFWDEYWIFYGFLLSFATSKRKGLLLHHDLKFSKSRDHIFPVELDIGFPLGPLKMESAELYM